MYRYVYVYFFEIKIRIISNSKKEAVLLYIIFNLRSNNYKYNNDNNK